MSGSLNQAQLIGHLGGDPEVRFTPSNKAVANFSVATNASWTDDKGQKQERVEWHKVVAWGKLAELCGEHLKKGRQVFVQGRLETRDWTDRENVKRQTTEIIAEVVTFLGPAPSQSR
jgi:single-strand DNA-binding protein